jgi:SRSO17 transposase
MTKTFGQLQKALECFLSSHLQGLENDERVEALIWYCQGLGLELPGKTLLGIGKRLAPGGAQAVRQRMQRALQRGRFSHERVFARLQSTVFASADVFEAYCVDDTGFAKKGTHSVGVQRQYSGTLGKVGNCQIAVSLHAVADVFSACLGAELYLPEQWVGDQVRRQAAGIPSDVGFQTKPEIALDLLRAAHRNGAPKRPVIADAGYGDSRDFRDAINELGWHYVVAISSQTNVWPPGSRPRRPPRTGKRGPPPTRELDPRGVEPTSVKAIATRAWEKGSFCDVSWRNGSKGQLHGRFSAVRVQSAERRTKGKPASPPIWLLMERDESQKTGFKYYLSSLPKSTAIKTLVRLAKLRWRIERDYQDMKQNLGLDAYEGRNYGGFHKHFAMTALVHAFLSLHRESFSPGGAHQHVDMGRLSPCPCCGAHQLDRPLPNLSANIQALG